MLCRSLIFVNLTCLLSATVVLDSVAIIVGRRVVKASDIERDLRASQFLNEEPLNISPEAKRKVADRLIIQELVRQDILAGGYGRPNERDVDMLLKQRLRGPVALSRYGLTEDQLRRYLLWQMTVLRFIEERFRPAVLVTSEEIRAYYEKHRGELRKAYPKADTLDELEPAIQEIIVGERVNEQFEQWIQEMKRRTRIEFRDTTLGSATTGGRLRDE